MSSCRATSTDYDRRNSTSVTLRRFDIDHYSTGKISGNEIGKTGKIGKTSGNNSGNIGKIGNTNSARPGVPGSVPNLEKFRVGRIQRSLPRQRSGNVGNDLE